MASRAFLGIDCGTRSTKALLLDADSMETLGVGRGEHGIIERPDGTREQEPAWWLAALETAVHEAAKAADPAGRGEPEIAGIAVSGQQHGLVILGDQYQSVRPAKLWNDTTTVPQCDVVTDRLGGRDEVLRLTGNLFLPGYTAPKIAWLIEEEPEHYRAARRFCLPHDYLNLWLSGAFATEPGDASGTAYFDARERTYAQEVLAAIDPDRRWEDSLPPVVPSRSLIGNLRQVAAERLGLPPGVPIAAGGGDNMCAAIGVGAIEPGPVVVSLGTSGTVFAYSDRPAVDPQGEAAAFCDSTGGWLPLACTLNCTGATEWVLALTGLDHAAFEQALDDSPPGARGLTFLPYLAGERTPDLPEATGSLYGLREPHDRSDIVRAVAEGVTLGLRYALEAIERAGVEPREVILVGGGANSDAWAQLCADILKLPVARPRAVEAAALGAALQARWVVDGVAPPMLDSAAASRFEPRGSAGLEEAAARQAALRAHEIKSQDREPMPA